MSGIDKSRVEAAFEVPTADGVIPSATQKTGQITSSGTVVTGIGTSFKTYSQIRKGDYIYAQGQVRMVTGIFSDTRVDIDRAFSPDIAVAVDLYVVRSLIYNKVTITNVSGGPATISTSIADGQALVANQSLSFESKNGVSPIAYTRAGATLNITKG